MFSGGQFLDAYIMLEMETGHIFRQLLYNYKIHLILEDFFFWIGAGVHDTIFDVQKYTAYCCHCIPLRIAYEMHSTIISTKQFGVLDKLSHTKCWENKYTLTLLTPTVLKLN